MCDVWSLGVFLNLLLTGFAPFVGGNQEEIFNAISQNPPNLNSPHYEKIPNAKDLVAKMLEKNPQKRIKIEEIMKHKWFQSQKLKVMISPMDH